MVKTRSSPEVMQSAGLELGFRGILQVCCELLLCQDRLDPHFLQGGWKVLLA